MINIQSVAQDSGTYKKIIKIPTINKLKTSPWQQLIKKFLPLHIDEESDDGKKANDSTKSGANGNPRISETDFIFVVIETTR